MTIPAMVLAEIGYLSVRNWIETVLNAVDQYCQQFSPVKVKPITMEIIRQCFDINDIPELHDRIIAAVACIENAILITNDPMMVASNFVSTVW